MKSASTLQILRKEIKILGVSKESECPIIPDHQWKWYFGNPKAEGSVRSVKFADIPSVTIFEKVKVSPIIQVKGSLVSGKYSLSARD